MQQVFLKFFFSLHLVEVSFNFKYTLVIVNGLISVPNDKALSNKSINILNHESYTFIISGQCIVPLCVL